MLRASYDAPPTKWQCSHGADLLALSEYHINKHFTGSKDKLQTTTSKVQTLNVFCWEHIILCTLSHLLSFWLHCHTVLIATKLLWQCNSGLKGWNPLLHQTALLRTFFPMEITTNQLKSLCICQFSNCDLVFHDVNYYCLMVERLGWYWVRNGPPRVNQSHSTA